MRNVNVVLVLISLTVAGCGNDSPTAPSRSTPQLQRTNLSFSPTVPGRGWVLQDVTVFQLPVQVTATLQWGDGRKDLDLYWTNALCTIVNGDFAGTGCIVINRSISNVGTLETVSGPAAAGSTVRFFTFNYSAAPESTTLSVIIQQ